MKRSGEQRRGGSTESVCSEAENGRSWEIRRVSQRGATAQTHTSLFQPGSVPLFHLRQRQKWQDVVGLICSDITLNSKAGSHLETFIGGALSLRFLEHSGPPPPVGARNHSPTRPSLRRTGSEKSRGPT